MSRYVIVGGSAGLGHGLSAGLPETGDRVWLVSRSRPPSLDREDGVERIWIPGDLCKPSAATAVKKYVEDEAVDALIHCAGTWEPTADITKTAPEAIYEILSVNTASFVAVAAALADNLRAAGHASVFAIGSTAGLENATGPRAAFAASKFGMRGAVHSLRQVFRPDKIRVTCISCGGLASDVEVDEGVAAALDKHQGRRIPTSDFIALIRCLMRLSPATCIKEIDMPAMLDATV